MAGWNEHQAQIVAAVLADAQWLIAHERVEWYNSQRPYQRPTRPPATRVFSGDCTGTIKLLLCDWHGIPSLDGLPSGYGDTGTFYRAPRAYHVPLDVKAWQPLDVLLYKHHSGTFRGGSAEHATMLLEKTKKGTWMCFSMGSSPGPKRERWNYRNDLAAVRRFRIPLK